MKRELKEGSIVGSNQFKLKILIIFGVLILLVSCGTKGGANIGLQASDFHFLHYGISLEEVEQKVGQPDGIMGYSDSIVYYQLNDGKMINLYFNIGNNGLSFVELYEEIILPISSVKNYPIDIRSGIREFRFLRYGMSLEEVKKRVGAPDKIDGEEIQTAVFWLSSEINIKLYFKDFGDNLYSAYYWEELILPNQ
jgi:hypothetical protein